MSLLLSTYDFEAAVIRAGESVGVDQRSDQPERRAAWPRRHPSPVLHVVADKHTFESGCTVAIPEEGSHCECQCWPVKLRRERRVL